MRKNLIKPRSLRPGDTIGVAAPASPFDQKAFELGVAVLESLGYHVKVPQGVFRRHGYLAGSDEERAAVLMNFFEDDLIRAIFCARGGFGSMRLLPLMDFDLIRGNPKVFVGFSDITMLLTAFYERCRMVTFHGPLVTTLGRDPAASCSALRDAVQGNGPLALRPGKPLVINHGRASGPVLGGNLTSLCHLVGTPFEPSFEGHLLFLEDRGEAPYRIDRMLSQLRLCGHLDKVAGVLVGSFQGCEPLDDVCRILKEAFESAGVPILGGFDLGHCAPNLTVPIGLEALLDTEEGVLRFLESATE